MRKSVAPSKMAGLHGRDPSSPGGLRGAPFVVEVAIARHDRVDMGHHDLLVTVLREQDVADVEVRIRHTRLVARRLGDLDLCLVVSARRHRIGLPVGEAPGRGQSPRAVRSARWSSRHRQRLLGQLATLGDKPGGLPEAPQRGHQAQGQAALAGIDRPAHGRPKVGDLRRHAVQPFAMARRVELVANLRGQREERLGVAPANAGLDARAGQTVQGERLDRSQHPKASPPARRRHRDDQAVVGELEEVIEAVAACRRRTGHRVDLLEVEAALEDSQPMEQVLAIGIEEVVAPGDRALQRALTRRRVALPAARQRKASGESIADHGR